MSEQDKWRYETDGAARAEFSAITEAREQSEVEVLKKRIAGLEKAINVIDSACVSWGFAFDIANPKESLNKLLRIETESARDPQICKEAQAFAIEQQAKGLEEMLDVTDTWSVMNTYAITVEDIYEQMQELRKQAAKLKEQEQ